MLILIIISINGCQKETAPQVYIHDANYINKPDLYNQTYMVNYLGYEAKIEEDVTKTVEIDIQGYKYICNYVNTHYNNNVKFAETEYECGKLINFSFDKVTNELLSFAIVRFPEDYVKKTKPITGEQAKQLADEFLKDYINFKKWTWINNGYQGSISNTYRIKYEYIINNVITRRAYIEMDN